MFSNTKSPDQQAKYKESNNLAGPATSEEQGNQNTKETKETYPWNIMSIVVGVCLSIIRLWRASGALQHIVFFETLIIT